MRAPMRPILRVATDPGATVADDALGLDPLLASGPMATDPQASAALGTPAPGDGVEAERVRGAVVARLLGEVEGTPRIGRYAVLSKLGEGGMGIVYAGFDEQLDRKVAIKLLRAQLTDEGLRVRMIREAQALARLSHPNVVQVYEVGEHDGRAFLAMEFVRGETLRAWVAAAPRTWREVLAIYAQAGAGLAAAHAVGLVHRDFKPDNALLGRDGRVRVLDFGLARHDREAASIVQTQVRPGAEAGEGLDTPLTRTGSLMGTPAYMAPEQFLGDATDARTDQFGFCVALYEALYGERPFAGHSRTELVANVTRGNVRAAPRGAVVPTWVRNALVQGLAVAPSQRFADMHALLTALARDPARQRRRLGLGAVALAGVGSVVALRGSAEPATAPCSGAPAALAEVVDDARVARVLAALTDTGLSFAPDIASRVQSRLDGFRQAWLDGHRDACEATTVRGEQSAELLDRRMACLHAARTELGAVLTILETPTPPVVEKAVDVLARVADPARCAVVDALLEGAAPPDPDQAEAVEALRAEVLATAARASATADPGAGAALDALVQRAEGLGYAPLVAQAHYERVDRSQPKQAIERLRHSYALAVAARNDDIARRSASLLGVTLGEQAQFDEGRAWADTAQAWADRGHVSADARVSLATNRSGLETAAGRYDEGIAIAEAALADAAEVRDPRPLATLRNNYAVLLVRSGRPAEALPHIERALDEFAAALGPGHPDLGMPINVRATALLRTGRLDEAKAVYEAGIDLVTRAVGPEEARVLLLRANLAELARLQGDFAAALVQGQALREIRARRSGEDSEEVASSDYNIANALLSLDRPREALPVIERALATRLRLLGAEHPKIVQTRGVRGELRLLTGDVPGGLDDAEQALALAGRVFAADHPVALDARLRVAKALAAAGKPNESRAVLGELLAAMPRVPADAGAVGLWHESAVLAERAGDRATARDGYRRALELGASVLPADHPRLVDARARLAALGD